MEVDRAQTASRVVQAGAVKPGCALLTALCCDCAHAPAAAFQGANCGSMVHRLTAAVCCTAARRAGHPSAAKPGCAQLLAFCRQSAGASPPATQGAHLWRQGPQGSSLTPATSCASGSTSAQASSLEAKNCPGWMQFAARVHVPMQQQVRRHPAAERYITHDPQTS